MSRLCRLKSTQNSDMNWAYNEITSLRDEIERLRKLTEWQPIETAPKDGTVIQLWVGRIEPGSWRVDEGYSGNDDPLWLDLSNDEWSSGYTSNPLSPTHWMPLPACPAAE